MGYRPRPEPETGLVLAFDVGGTDLKAAVQDASGTFHGLIRVPTPRSTESPGDAVVEKAAGLALDFGRRFADAPIQSVGLVVPGLVDEDAGIGILSTNLGWRSYPFSERMRQATSLPVAFGHDVGRAGEAEMRLGAGRGLQDVVILVVGTGIAGAVFCGGQRVHGGGFAGEIGHAPVTGGIRCACGADGCLETIASAGAIARIYKERTGIAVPGAAAVLAAAAAGDSAAQSVWAQAVEALATAISQLTAVLGTEAVILGGGLSQAGPALLEPLRREVESRLSFHRRPQLLVSLLGQDAGLMGAALSARDLLALPQ